MTQFLVLLYTSFHMKILKYQNNAFGSKMLLFNKIWRLILMHLYVYGVQRMFQFTLPIKLLVFQGVSFCAERKDGFDYVIDSTI